ncbi:hypothetical protein ABPG72_019706 [Tetrahymena utriculariae]
MKFYTIALQLVVLIGISTAMNPASCNMLTNVSCTLGITTAVNNCKESKDISKCYNEFQAQKECINCTCNIFPRYCSEKSGDIDKDGSTNPFSKVKTSNEDTHYIDIQKILLTAIQCDPNLFQTCQTKIQYISGECLMLNDSKPIISCIQDKVKNTECNTCVCKILPQFCDKEQLEKAENEKNQKPAASNGTPNIGDVLLGGLLQSGLNSDKLKDMLSNGSAKDNVTNLLQDQGIQNKIKELLKNQQITDQIKNLIQQNPEQVSKLAQNLADNKQTSRIVYDIAESQIQKEKEKQEQEKKKKEEEEKQKMKKECTKSLKSKCKIDFFKLLKKFPPTQNGYVASIQTELSGNECETCICTFIKNACQ